ncbi:hypothetical protein Ddye_031498 [Dipteronia dyeriana]|uniref:RNase H type-1 domain-containing protein n=1 Tax=Dipteronia dyeriana TaxID=168575 RepID=A0AAD9WMN9_9ROSI|nr:hypothetical protein Ddye_031498 [Dipteronia dyeriana]
MEMTYLLQTIVWCAGRDQGLGGDADGQMLAASNGLLAGPLDAGLAEAFSFREALSWLKAHSFSKVIMETDALKVVQALKSRVSDPNYFGLIIDDCNVLLKEIPDCTVCFVRRSANNDVQVAKKMKRTKPNNKVDGNCNIKSLPKDLFTDVLAHLASALSPTCSTWNGAIKIFLKWEMTIMSSNMLRERQSRGSIKTRHVGILHFVGNRIRTLCSYKEPLMRDV